MSDKKVIKVFIEREEDFTFEYFVSMNNGHLVTTSNIKEAKIFNGYKGANIAKGFIKRWGHDLLLLTEEAGE